MEKYKRTEQREPGGGWESYDAVPRWAVDLRGRS